MVGDVLYHWQIQPPAWSPPAEVRREKPYLPDVIAAGSPGNPMGVAAMTLAGGEYPSMAPTSQAPSAISFPTVASACSTRTSKTSTIGSRRNAGDRRVISQWRQVSGSRKPVPVTKYVHCVLNAVSSNAVRLRGSHFACRDQFKRAKVISALKVLIELSRF
jgi:hypothetical protein